MRVISFIIGFILLTLTTLVTSSFASIGEVKLHTGFATVDRQDGDKNIEVKKELDIFSYDTLKTGQGKVGIVSKSGTLTYEAADQVVKQGLGITTAIGIGGDPIIGTTTKEAVELLINDDATECVVMIGEIGGQLEADAAKWYKESGSTKPVVGFIAGETAPKGRTMGHAGAIVGGADDTAEAKKRIMRECGIHVVDSPAEIGKKVAEVMA